jgi:hypothetical protein
MLSSNCHAGPKECAREYNRTHGLPTAHDPGDGKLDFGSQSYFERDWISGPIPRAHPKALTGLNTLEHSTEESTDGNRRHHAGVWWPGAKGKQVHRRKRRRRKES